MKQPKISIIIIHYNTPALLKTCLETVFSQTYKNIEVILIDNNSEDKTCYPNVKIIENKENFGYAKAANQGIRLSKGEYAAIVNPDVIFTENYFKNIIAPMEKDHSIASITGKIYKYDFENNKPAKIIDSTGLLPFKNRRIIDKGQGEEDKGQYNEECEVFGVSGACPLYRRKALEEVKIFDEYFDEDFFMYKEDVDLAWRLRLYNWKNIYYPKAVAYHKRGTGTAVKTSLLDAVKQRKSLSKFQKKHSFKNQLLMQLKNETWGTFFADFFPIIFRKIITAFYITLREPYLWGSYFAYIKAIPRSLKKRKIIMKNKKAKTKEIKKWFK